MTERQNTSGVRRLALAAVIAHAIVLIFHSAAHQILGVEASPTQTLFIVTVIITAPVLAGILLWRRVERFGAVLLTCSMAGSLIFGVYNHFVVSSPDHVSHVSGMSPASWAIIFQVTAFLLALTEALGVFAGTLTLKKSPAR
jgi:Na+/proline symporter